jgi:SAM-dependent methyltransferase
MSWWQRIRSPDDRRVLRRRLRRAMAGIVAEHLAAAGAGPSGRVLLDLGCGQMPYRDLFAPHVGRYLGADLPGNPAADLHFDAASGRVPMPDGSADVVLSTQVLEHVPDPERYLAEAGRLLKPGGLLILGTHGFWMYHPTPTDYWRWTAEGLRLLLERSGWEVVHLHGVLGLAAGALQLLQDAAVARIPRFLRGLLVLLMQPLIRLADSFYSPEGRLRDGCVLLAVARPGPGRSGAAGAGGPGCS